MAPHRRRRTPELPPHGVAGAGARASRSSSSRCGRAPACSPSCAVVAGILLALLGLAVALGLRLGIGLPKALGENGFGLCSGLSPTDSATPALTPWLADLVDDLAAKDGRAAGPLTFGDLGARGIDLQMMTTNVTHRRPHRMPWSSRELLFDPAELRLLFPERIVAWMEAHPPPAGAGRDAERTRRRLEALAPLRPFPAPDDLPVVVAARMSLSFPLLISAVPLRALDMTSKRTREAVEAIENGRPAAQPLVADVCWFSDGGIASNFPVHFFDTPLPTRPTFAIDLDGFHPDHPRGPDEAGNVYLPSSNVGGLLDSWNRIDPKPGLGSLVGFVSGIVRTMQNHVDATLTHQPGYRDRIVHVHTAPDEGGMNLTMPQHVIDALTLRGQAAGRALVERFADTPGTDAGLSWDNHRWVRYRSALAALAEQLERFGRRVARRRPTASGRTASSPTAATTSGRPATASHRTVNVRWRWRWPICSRRPATARRRRRRPSTGARRARSRSLASSPATRRGQRPRRPSRAEARRSRRRSRPSGSSRHIHRPSPGAHRRSSR